jgi:hypothetical protein
MSGLDWDFSSHTLIVLLPSEIMCKGRGMTALRQGESFQKKIPEAKEFAEKGRS